LADIKAVGYMMFSLPNSVYIKIYRKRTSHILIRFLCSYEH